MKKFVFSIMFFVFCFFGCASNNENTGKEDSKSENIVESNNVETNEEESSSIDEVGEFVDYDVDIILSMMSFDGDRTIEEYVQDLQDNNPDKIYSVYDDSHYIQTIKESERSKLIEENLNAEVIKEEFHNTFSDEMYCGAHIDIEYDELFQNVKIYVDKKLYDESVETNPLVNLGTFLYCGVYSDMIQAVNLIPVEDRVCSYELINYETGEVIFDSESITD